MQEIRWGSIGCGDVMEVKSGPALQNVDHSSLVGVMRRSLGLAKDFAERHGVEKWFDKAESLVNDPDINAIYIATPPDTHLHYTRMAAQAQKPIYVEKPMANSYAQCMEMVQICENYDVPLFVAYYRRALPRFLKVKEIIDAGSLGEIKEVQIQLKHPALAADKAGTYNWRVHPDIAGCGYFCDLGSHIFDLLQFLLGDIESASGSIQNQGKLYHAEDYVKAEFKFRSGIKGQGIWDFNHSEDIDRTTIIGTDGEVSYTHFAESEVRLKQMSGEELFQIPNPVHIQQPLIQLIVDELRGIGNSPSTGLSAAKTNWVLDKVLGRSITSEGGAN